MSNEALKASGISRSFKTDGGEITILDSVDLSLNPGEMIGIVGASGAGKSTLLHILGGLDHPSSGTVTIDGSDLYNLSDNKRSGLRGKHVGFVFQFHHLLPEFSAKENVMMPSIIAGKNGAELTARVEELFSMVGLSERMEHRPGKLSGGEQQRTAIIRALINNPSILLADEPTGNLDEHTALEVFDILSNLVKEKNLACVVVTHNLNLAKKMDKVFELSGGKLNEKVF